jgi:hypothetical protein
MVHQCISVCFICADTQARESKRRSGSVMSKALTHPPNHTEREREREGEREREREREGRERERERERERNTHNIPCHACLLNGRQQALVWQAYAPAQALPDSTPVSHTHTHIHRLRYRKGGHADLDTSVGVSMHLRHVHQLMVCTLVCLRTSERDSPCGQGPRLGDDRAAEIVTCDLLLLTRHGLFLTRHSSRELLVQLV